MTINNTFDIVPVTPEEIASLRTGMRPETTAMLALGVNDAIRIKNHEHILKPSNNSMCRLQNTLRAAARLRDRTLTLRHDGPDLLVLRLK